MAYFIDNVDQGSAQKSSSNNNGLSKLSLTTSLWVWLGRQVDGRRGRRDGKWKVIERQ